MSEQTPPSQPENGHQSLWDDPLIEEVRATRRRLWEESGGDVKRYIEQSRQAAERWRRQHPRGGPRRETA